MAVLVAIRDLFFASKIDAALAHGDVDPPLRATRGEPLLAQVRAHRPARVLVELSEPGMLEEVRALKSDPALAAAEVVGYCRHTAAETIREAKAAGCDLVLTQGEFAGALPALLRGGPLPGKPGPCD